jgi:hypothetical protein
MEEALLVKNEAYSEKISSAGTKAQETVGDLFIYLAV